MELKLITDKLIILSTMINPKTAQQIQNSNTQVEKVKTRRGMETNNIGIKIQLIYFK